MKNLQELKAELENVKMISFELGNVASYRAYKVKTEALQEEINIFEFTEKMNSLNKREAKRREAMKFLFSVVGPISPDLLTNDMKLNKTKTKQAPELAKLVEGDKYVYFSYGHSNIIRIHIDGQEYNTAYTTYENGKTSEPQPFKSLEHAYECNNIQAGKISAAKVRKQLQRIDKATKAMEAAEQKYRDTLKANESYFLKVEKFANERNQHIYLTRSNF